MASLAIPNPLSDALLYHSNSSLGLVRRNRPSWYQLPTVQAATGWPRLAAEINQLLWPRNRSVEILGPTRFCSVRSNQREAFFKSRSTPQPLAYRIYITL